MTDSSEPNHGSPVVSMGLLQHNRGKTGHGAVFADHPAGGAGGFPFLCVVCGWPV
jgi:hypothetical protein